MRDRTRSIGRVCIILFAVSTAFPLVAGLRNAETPSRWLGVADVVVAAVLVVTAIGVAKKRRHRVSDNDRLIAFRVSGRLFAVIPALLIIFFVAGDRIDWQVLVVGLAWRGWLLQYTLPSLVSAVNSSGSPTPRSH